jgi:hypothetical protein
MFKYFKEKKQKLLRFLFGTFSFTALMFAFQACYGMPERPFKTVVQGKVSDMETNDPIQGLQVSSDIGFTTTTNENGIFIDPKGLRTIYEWGEYHITVTDIDSTENGLYETFDTLVWATELTQPIELQIKKVSDAQ